jgi:CRP-like cAMP-binding protein
MAQTAYDKVKQLEIIGKIPYLKNFCYEDRKKLAEIGFFNSYAPGDLIIEQGQLNLSLFFLIRGKVDISMDEKYILSFTGGGQIFGEMSLLSHNLATATVKAQNEVVMMGININDIHQLTGPDHYRLQMEVYKSVSEVLANKLINTNSMTKAFLADSSTGDL